MAVRAPFRSACDGTAGTRSLKRPCAAREWEAAVAIGRTCSAAFCSVRWTSQEVRGAVGLAAAVSPGSIAGALHGIRSSGNQGSDGQYVLHYKTLLGAATPRFP